MTSMHQDILARLPHQPPFRFVSRLEELELSLRGRGIWEVTGEEWFFKGHFPDRPVLPGVLLVEAMAQLAGMVALTGESTPMPVQGRLAHVDVRFRQAVTPPAEVVLHASVLRAMGGLRHCQVRAEVADALAAEGTIVLAAGGET